LTKIRIYELAKELNLSSKVIMDELKEFGIEVKNHMSAISDLDALKIRKKYIKKEETPPAPKETPAPEKKPQKPVSRTGSDSQKTAKSHPKPPQKTASKPPQKGGQPRPKTPAKTAAPRQTPEEIAAAKEKIKRGPKAEAPIKNKTKSSRKDYSKKTKKSKAFYKSLPKEEEKGPKPGDVIVLPPELTVGEFADLLKMNVNDLIMKIMTDYEKMVGINENLESDVAQLIAIDLGFEVEMEKTQVQLDELEFEFEDKPEDLVYRAPVVTVMGHVDHGKTSLLDAIRNTDVTKGEAGGITQHIGASEIYINNKKIVFLDTPGHEAFTTLRARGAQVTDIAILVVAADDGVMPQTLEAIDHARAAGVPIIVAINKIDKDNANPTRVKQELSDNGLVVEEWGGSTIAVEISAIKGQGIDTLLEMVVLVAEMEELKANPKRPAIGTIIEANLDKGRGPVATALVQNGTLRVGDPIFAGTSYGKVRAMFNDKGKNVKSAKPSTSVEILGINSVPVAGEKFYVTRDEKTARLHAEANVNVFKEQAMRSNRKNISLEDLFDQIKDGEVKDLNIVLKADVHGSIEALRQSLENISNEEVRVKIIHSQIGAITESDILLASASNAIVIGFNVRPSASVQQTADREEVEIRTYRIIYEAIKEVKDALSGLLDPEYREVIEGRVEVRTTFKVPNAGTIAGAYVLDGKISRKSKVRLIRDGIVIFEGGISSLKRFKDDAKEVLTGFECGVGLENYNDLKEGDIIEPYKIVEIERTLD